MLYAFTENFVLPLSHDEVVHGKGSLCGQDAGRRLAEVRQPAAPLGYMFAQAGQEAAVHGRRVRPMARMEPRRRAGLAICLSTPEHAGLQRGWRSESRLSRRARPCTCLTTIRRGFQWIDPHDSEQSVLAYLRRGHPSDAEVIVLCNFTPVPRHTTASAPRMSVFGRRSSTATPRLTGAAAGETSAAWKHPTWPRMASPIRWS